MRRPEDIHSEVHGDNYLRFPRPLLAEDVRDLEYSGLDKTSNEQRVRSAWQAEYQALHNAISSGTFVVKPGHYMSGVPGTGTQEVRAPYSKAQLERRKAKLKILELKLARVRPQKLSLS